MLNALSFLQTGGRTNTQEAIRKAHQDAFTSNKGDRGGVPNIMVNSIKDICDY